MPDAPHDLESRLAELKIRFRAQLVSQAAILNHALETGGRDVILETCHARAGRAGMFGETAIGDAAREVEEALREDVDDELLTVLVKRLLDRVDAVV